MELKNFVILMWVSLTIIKLLLFHA